MVSSDSSKIRTISKQWGADYVANRPKDLATSKAPKILAIQQAVLETERVHRMKFDFIIDLDATAPLHTIDDIINSFKMLAEHPKATNFSHCLFCKKISLFQYAGDECRRLYLFSKER